VLSLALESGAYISQKAASMLRDGGLETCRPRAFCKPDKSHRIYDLLTQAKGAHTCEYFLVSESLSLYTFCLWPLVQTKNIEMLLHYMTKYL